ncbi:MAG: alpha/beta hydrolase [Acidobacteriota bacterium]
MFGYEMVCVHGAWEGPWVFRTWTAYFAGEGWSVRALTLPGHEPGGDARGVGLEEAAAAVAEGIRDPERTVLVGHSLGGWLALKYLEKNAVAASVLLMPLPPRGLSLEVRRRVRACGGWRLKTRVLMGRNCPLENAEAVRALGFGEGGQPASVRRFLAESVPESGRLLRQIALLPATSRLGGGIREGRLKKKQCGRPHLIVASGADALVTPSDLEGTARLLGAEMLRLETAPHVALLTDLALPLAGQVNAWLSRRLGPAEGFDEGP